MFQTQISDKLDIRVVKQIIKFFYFNKKSFLNEDLTKKF